MEKITSRQNKTVREAAALLSSAEERAARGEFLCEGARLCQDAARSGIEVLRCFVTAQALEKYAAYLQPVLERARQSYLVAGHVAGLLSSTKSPQGVFCQCRWPQGLLAGDAAGGGSCAVLEDLQDPGNLGTILRTGEGAGVTGIILGGDCVDLYNPKTIRSTMGSVYRMPVCRCRDLTEALAEMKKKGILMYAAHLEGKNSYDQEDYRKPCAFLIGNEGNGLRREVAEAADRWIRIPMKGQVESLNAAVAATVLMFEASRQRR